MKTDFLKSVFFISVGYLAKLQLKAIDSGFLLPRMIPLTHILKSMFS